jgi:DNA-binding response OmpR family regulator
MNRNRNRNEQATETILIIEDDVSLAQGLAHNLRYEGYRVLVAADGDSGLRTAVDELPDLIVLDLMLPGLSGLEVLESLRGEDLGMQVIILSARGQEKDKVLGLKLGADDYVAKPFGLQELLARVEAALRRPRLQRRAQAEEEIAFGRVAIHAGKRQVYKDDTEVHLTAREFELLMELVTHPNRAFSREHLLRRVWGYDYEGTERTVDNFVRSLRRKLETDPAQPQHLLTVHGVGYRFEP